MVSIDCLSVSIIPRRIDQFSSDHWSQTTTGRVSTYMGDRLGIPCVLSIFSFCPVTEMTTLTWFHSLKWKKHHFWPNKKSRFERDSTPKLASRSAKQGGVLTLKIYNFTHPIFESDFDCLTGNDRFQALLSHSPLASYNLKQKTRKSTVLLQ